MFTLHCVSGILVKLPSIRRMKSSDLFSPGPPPFSPLAETFRAFCDVVVIVVVIVVVAFAISHFYWFRARLIFVILFSNLVNIFNRL